MTQTRAGCNGRLPSTSRNTGSTAPDKPECGDRPECYGRNDTQAYSRNPNQLPPGDSPEGGGSIGTPQDTGDGDTDDGQATSMLGREAWLIAKAHEMCNRYTLDTMSAGECITWAMECWERGIDLGRPLPWGDEQAGLRTPVILEHDAIGGHGGKDLQLAQIEVMQHIQELPQVGPLVAQVNH